MSVIFFVVYIDTKITGSLKSAVKVLKSIGLVYCIDYEVQLLL